MTLTLNLKPEFETKVKHEAAKHGLDVNDYVLNAVQECLQRDQKKDTLVLGIKESQLLQKINQGISPETWQRYHELIEKRRQETLTPEELEQLIQLSDQLEQLNAKRMGSLVKLAQIRQIPLRSLMKQLGITPAHV